MSSGKIIASILAISATLVFISQTLMNNSESTTENFVALGYPLTIRKDTTETPTNSLVGHLPDTAFFSNGHYETKSVMGSINNVANQDMGMAVQLSQVTNPTQSDKAMFSSFAAAAGNNVESYTAKQSSSGCTSTNALEPVELPVSGFTASEVPTGMSQELGADGNIQAAFNTTRLMYTTLKRPQCGVDRIRGDLAIAPCPIVSRMAAKPADTLESGAFAALFGSYAEEPQKTAALISADTMGMRTALGGANQVHEVQNAGNGPILTSNTFIPTAYEKMEMMSSNRGSSGNSLTGQIKGYTSF